MAIGACVRTVSYTHLDVYKRQLHTFGSPPDNAYGLANESSWAAFMQAALPVLRDAGWQVEFDDDFRHHALHVDAWEADLLESESGWFDLDTVSYTHLDVYKRQHFG